MGNYVVESQAEAIRILRSALEEVVVLEGNFKYAVAEGIIAIEKQIPSKIFHQKWVGIDGVPYDLCPNCKTNLCTNGMFPSKKEKYCGECGQKLDWEE